MKTSGAQFELLITFMQQHGDLSKPSSDANGRFRALRKWQELTELLNSDGSGDTKTTEKWKKVWADFKNNTKKKAARLHRAAIATGGGPAILNKLTDLEHRVLNLVGVNVATGLPVQEAGMSQATGNNPAPRETSPLHLDTGDVGDYTHSWNEPGPSTRPDPPLVSQDYIEIPQHDPCDEFPARVVISPPQVVEVQDTDILAPSREAGASTPLQPALSGQTQERSSQLHVGVVLPAQSRQSSPRRVRARRLRGSPRRQVSRPTNTEQAAQHFIHSDEEWRKFKIQQHNDYMEAKREKNRLRELEIEAQRGWQDITNRLLNVLEKVANKYCYE